MSSSKTVASQLRSLDLSFNELTRLEYSLSPLTELRDLKLYANSLTDEGLLVSGLEKLSRLENLELYDNQLTEPPQQLVTATKLLSLRLERNRLESLRNMGGCRLLSSLSVDGNRLHGLTETDGSGWLFACQNLKSFSCSDNDLDKLTVKALAGCPNLTDLVLSRNCLNDGSLKALSSLNSLRTLRLDGNHLVSLVKMPTLKKLEEFYVSSNRLTQGALDRILTAMPRLEILDVSGNRFEGESCVALIGTPLRDLKSLCELSCQDNPCCDDSGWGQLASALPQLQLLDDRKVTKSEGGVAMPSLSLRPSSARPTSALSARMSSRGTALTPRGGLTPRDGTSRPLMHPPSARTGYGTDLKVDSLEDVEALARGFRDRVGVARASLHLRNPRPTSTARGKVDKEEVRQDKCSEDRGLAVATTQPREEKETSSPKDNSKRLSHALGFAAKDDQSEGRVAVFGSTQQPPPPPRMSKPWEQSAPVQTQPKTTESVAAKVPLVDFSTLRVSSGDSFLDIPQPSPRFQVRICPCLFVSPSVNCVCV